MDPMDLMGMSRFFSGLIFPSRKSPWRTSSFATSFATETTTTEKETAFSAAAATAESVGATEQASWWRSGGKEENTGKKTKQQVGWFKKGEKKGEILYVMFFWSGINSWGYGLIEEQPTD